MSIILLGIVLAVVFAIIGVLAVKGVSNKTNEGGRADMLKLGYHYAVAFITLIMVIGGGIFAFMAIADYVSPNTYVETFEEYKNMYIYPPKHEESQEVQIEVKTDEELREQYDNMVQQRKENTRNRALNSFVKSLGWVIIPLPIYLIFQRRIRKEKNDA
ncbi:hypothetical protein [Bacillus solitudinis]|uniref:hypothetical protein n=1 Tax=Bacillus solitudinis TaxID=2014074 RepID=UPI000C2425F0|nr:hypothetical protein [Bacillus solitudinis]